MTIALIAHDGKKADMVKFIMSHLELLNSYNIKLVATGTTGKYVEQTGLKVKKLLSGPKGGDAQIATLAAEKKVDMIFFFRDALGIHPHEPDISMLMRICDVHNVPLATNPVSAELILKGLTYNINK